MDKKTASESCEFLKVLFLTGGTTIPKALENILSSSAVRGCLSCESIKGDKTHVLETARILVAQNRVLMGLMFPSHPRLLKKSQNEVPCFTVRCDILLFLTFPSDDVTPFFWEFRFHMNNTQLLLRQCL